MPELPDVTVYLEAPHSRGTEAKNSLSDFSFVH